MASATRWTSEEQREELTAPPPRRETQYKAMLENFKYRIKIQSAARCGNRTDPSHFSEERPGRKPQFWLLL
ncbi:hypothetical protein E5288_WYG008196 [Bos mutus]|uniref:Uncharacterized protein n=1 Tax=Bos mutus TaxID=72004 RepID=A0A6B0RXE2_9CETA|nr:hypothetical protein [Bos mutus]